MSYRHMTYDIDFYSYKKLSRIQISSFRPFTTGFLLWGLGTIRHEKLKYIENFS